ncbi:hypothetical protein QFC21_003676 [Naganishia friedmannii]|uniref:Uncharacterized protein n=1 Tax=Naganishia friedmannii TaxID=89922 RepID=A0ACC2VNY9_9TREE|nr:hypothetical protein QFC21_003676 [Naganishia friedmannii]
MPITRIGPTSTPSTVRVQQVGTAASPITSKPASSALGQHPSSLLPVKPSHHHHHRPSLSTPSSRDGFISDSTTETDDETSSSSSDLEDGSAVQDSEDGEEQGDGGQGGYFSQRRRSRKKIKRRKRFRGTVEDESLIHLPPHNGDGLHPLSPPSAPPITKRATPPIDYLALASAERRRSSFASTTPAVPHSLPNSSTSTSTSTSTSSRRESGSVLSRLGKVGLVGRGISVADIETVEPLANTSPTQTQPQPAQPISPTSSTDSNPPPARRTTLNILSGAFDPTSIRRDPTDLGTQYAIDAGVTAHADLGGRGKQHFSAYSRGHGKRLQLPVDGLEASETGTQVGAGGRGQGETTTTMMTTTTTRPQVKTAQSGYFWSLSQARVEEPQQPVQQSQTTSPPSQQQGEEEAIDLTPVARTGTLPSSLPRSSNSEAAALPAGTKTVTSSPVASTSTLGPPGISLPRIPTFNASSSSASRIGDTGTTHMSLPVGGDDGEGDHELPPPPGNPRKHRFAAVAGVLGLEIDGEMDGGAVAEERDVNNAPDNAARYYHHYPYAKSASTSPVKQFNSLSAASSSAGTADQVRRSPRARGLQRHRSGEVLRFRRAEQDASSFPTATGFATVENLLARRNFTLPFPSDRRALEQEHTDEPDSLGGGAHLVPDISANGRLVILTPTTQEWRALGLDHLKDLGGEGGVSESESERGKVGRDQGERRESEASSESSIISPDNRDVDGSRPSSFVGVELPETSEGGRASRPPDDRSSSTSAMATTTTMDRVNARDLMIQIPAAAAASSGSVSFHEASDGGDIADRSGTGGSALSLSLRSAPPLLEETDIFAQLLSQQMAQRQRQSSSATSSGVQSRALSPAPGTANAMEQASMSNINQDKPSQTNSPRPMQENLGPAFSLSRSQSMREPPSAAPHMTKREKERERLFRMVGEEIERSGLSDSQGAARGIKQIGRGLGLESPVSEGTVGFPIIRTESGPAALQQRDHQRKSPEGPLLLPLPQRFPKQSTSDVPMPASASDDNMARSSLSSAKSRSRAHSRAPSLAQLAISSGTGPRVEHPSMSPPGLAAPAPLSALTSRRRQSQRLSLLAGRTPLPHQFPAVLPPSAPTGPHGPRKPSAGLSAFSAFATITPTSPAVRRPLLNKDTATSGSLSAIPGHLQHIGRSDSALSFAPSTVAPSECGTPVGETAGGLGGGGIDDYVIQSEVGKGAYGLVRRARRKGDDGNPIGDEVIIKYIIKSRILADCWKKHKVLGPIPIEIHVMEQLRNVTYRKPKAPHPWDPLRAGHHDFLDQPEKDDSAGTGQDTPTTSHSSQRGNGVHSRDDAFGRIDTNTAKPAELQDLSAWQAKLSSDNLQDRGHPNIVKMLDFFEDREFYYLVMPRFGAGLDLFDRVESAPDGLGSFDIRSLLGQLSDALAFLHTNGIVHRDIKDENVILDGQGHCQLIDFGSAAHWRPGRKWDTFSGTLDYASPEILRGEMYSGKEQDVWALGVVGFVMICGETPFLSAEEAAVGLADGTKARDDLMARCGGERGAEGEEFDGGGRMADALDFVERCLELKVEDRPPAEALMEHRFVFGRDGWGGFKGWLRAWGGTIDIVS